MILKALLFVLLTSISIAQTTVRTPPAPIAKLATLEVEGTSTVSLKSDSVLVITSYSTTGTSSFDALTALENKTSSFYSFLTEKYLHDSATFEVTIHESISNDVTEYVATLTSKITLTKLGLQELISQLKVAVPYLNINSVMSTVSLETQALTEDVAYEQALEKAQDNAALAIEVLYNGDPAKPVLALAATNVLPTESTETSITKKVKLTYVYPIK